MPRRRKSCEYTRRCSGCSKFAPRNRAVFGIEKWVRKQSSKLFSGSNEICSCLCPALACRPLWPLPSVQIMLVQKTFLCDIVLSLKRSHACKAKRCESIYRDCVCNLQSFFDSKQHGVLPSPIFLWKLMPFHGSKPTRREILFFVICSESDASVPSFQSDLLNYN